MDTHGRQPQVALGRLVGLGRLVALGRPADPAHREDPGDLGNRMGREIREGTEVQAHKDDPESKENSDASRRRGSRETSTPSRCSPPFSVCHSVLTRRPERNGPYTQRHANVSVFGSNVS